MTQESHQSGIQSQSAGQFPQTDTAVTNLRNEGYETPDISRAILTLGGYSAVEATHSPYQSLKGHLDSQAGSAAPRESLGGSIETVLDSFAPKPAAGSREKRKPQRNTPKKYQRPGKRGRGETPWEWFQEAGFDKAWLTNIEWYLVSVVYRVVHLGEGWGDKDTGKGSHKGIPILPQKMAKKCGCHPETIRRAKRFLLSVGLYEAVRECAGDAPDIRLGFWRKYTNKETDHEETVKALSECYQRVRSKRRARPRPGKPINPPGEPTSEPTDEGDSVGGSVGGSAGGSVVGTVVGTVVPPHTTSEWNNLLSESELATVEIHHEGPTLNVLTKRQKKERLDILSEKPKAACRFSVIPIEEPEEETPDRLWLGLRSIANGYRLRDREPPSALPAGVN